MNGWDLYDRIKRDYSWDAAAEIWAYIRQTAQAARIRGEKQFTIYLKPDYVFRFELGKDKRP